jgi:hypothetical protein
MEGSVSGMGDQGPLDIVTLAQRNDAVRRQTITGRFSQLVAMTVAVGEDIGEEEAEAAERGS